MKVKTILKVKLNPDAVMPSYAKIGDAGLDLTAVDRVFDPKEGIVEYRTGITMELPEGYVGLLFPRSSVCRQSLMLSNSVGVLDSSYRGEILLKFRIINTAQGYYEIGDRIGQLLILPYPTVSLEEVEELSSTERGDGGFGSSGK